MYMSFDHLRECSVPTCTNFPRIAEEYENFMNEWMELYHHFHHLNMDALLSAVKSSLDALRRRITGT